jgi:hypothetical protein
MSGGSMNYACYTIEEQARYLEDRELIDIAKDMAKLFHDAEWWHSSDIDEKDYRETVKWFKDKWLRNGNVDERLRGYIDQIFDDAKQECNLLVTGESDREVTKCPSCGSSRVYITKDNEIKCSDCKYIAY